MACKYCGKKVVLTPSAEERAKTCRSGHSAKYYRELFPDHSSCAIAARDNKPNPVNGKYFKWDMSTGKAVLISSPEPFNIHTIPFMMSK